MRPCSCRSIHWLFGNEKWAERSPWRWPIWRRPTLKANSPRLPGPAWTPGHDVTSSVMRSLGRWLAFVMGGGSSYGGSAHDASSSALEVRRHALDAAEEEGGGESGGALDVRGALGPRGVRRAVGRRGGRRGCLAALEHLHRDLE